MLEKSYNELEQKIDNFNKFPTSVKSARVARGFFANTSKIFWVVFWVVFMCPTQQRTGQVVKDYANKKGATWHLGFNTP